MERIPVTSSNLSSVGYDQNSQTLEIEFNYGAVYQYFDVSQSEHEGLMNADSKGTYFNSNIKGRYSYAKL